jgi:ferrochelatase
LRFIDAYFDSDGYIAALATSVREHWGLHGRGAHLLMSFHGIPQSFVARGDRYDHECRQTAALLAAALDLNPQQWSLSYQSRFGANRWLSPATDRTLAELPRRGERAVTVLCPGFAVDCLETLEEIAMRNREYFVAAGGERFEYIAALNAGDDHVAALTELILRNGQGWPEFDPGWDAARVGAQRAAAQARAERMRDAR